MIIVRPLINVLGKIIKLPKDSYLDPTTLGSGTPTSSTVLIGDSTWGTVGSLGYVPYIGATQSVDLGNYGLYTDFVNFNLNPVASPGAGQIAYDGASGALSYLLNNSNVPSRIGQTMHAYVHNAEGSTITKGQAVYLYQASGNKASVKLAYNTTDSTSAKTFGLAAENIGAGQNGMVICQGVIEGLNTGMYNPGDTLYLGATPGSYTAVKPYAPNHLVYVGIVERANAGNGQIYVRVQNGYELDEIHDVDLITTPPVNNNVLTYNGSLWVPRLPTLTIGSSQIVSGTIGRVLFEGAGNVVQQDGSLFWDNTNKRLGIGTTSPSTRLDIQGTTATDGGQLGAELLSSSGWTSVDWTGDFTVGFTHTTGNTSVLSNTFAATIGLYYQIAYTITGRTAGSITIAFGGQSLASITATGTFGPLATTTGTLAITPTSDFDGTIVISIRTITAGTALINLRNSAGTVISEVRTSTSNTNNFIGVNSGTRITTGTGNVGLGRSALQQNTTGFQNVAIGFNAIGLNSTGFNNVAVGTSALFSNTTGITNTAVGNSALSVNTTGAGNVAIGASAMLSNISGSNNIAIGSSALRNTTTSTQTAVGNAALQANTTGTGNAAFGASALIANTTATNNTAIGTSTLASNTTGGSNTAVGNSALGANISGSSNVAIGISALRNTTTSNQVAVGSNALNANTTGTGNTAVGHTALNTNTTGTNNTAVGASALFSNTTSTGNSAFGASSLQSNTGGTQNTGIGANSLQNNVTGVNNTAIGYAALFPLATGSNNTSLGTNAGRWISGGTVNLTNSSNSVFIGNNAQALADSQTNQIVIGDSAIGLGSNTVVLGNTSIVTTQLRGSVISGNQAALATTATDGFLYIPTCAGLPTGVPTAVTGKVPIVADTTNNKLYVYLGGAWTAMN